MEIPSFKFPDVQLLVQDLAQSRRDLFKERENSANKIAEERERSRWEIERVRTELSSEIKSLNSENEALVRAIGRLQREADRLREENAVLRHGKTNGQAEEKPVEKTAEKVDVIASFNRPPGGSAVPLVIQQQTIPRKAQVVPPASVMGAPPQMLQPGIGPV
jgi:septal ring factor EnvC (AmiA/AmiB activator)